MDRLHIAKTDPWHPTTSPTTIGVYGKLIEEGGELIARAARCQIQGPYEIDPDKKKTNLQLLFEEIADLQACIKWLEWHEADDTDKARVDYKLTHFMIWYDSLKKQEGDSI